VYPLYKKSNATLTWVRGHEGDIGNEMADEWANKARENGDIGPVLVGLQAPKTAEEYVDEYLSLGQIMQLATSNDNNPWISTVYYIADSERNLYWLSVPERRHSKEVTNNPQVAIAVAIKQDIPVIGIQAAGTVEVVADSDVVETILAAYVKKYDGAGKDFHQRFIEGKNKHQLYKLTPDTLVLFDEAHFKENPAQKII
jgi:uncharacterized protein YhbP (UPF0306 family)